MSSPELDFKNLKRLLALKRHEQPPPGYFDNLREQVLTRLEADELVEYSSWWQWLVQKFDAKPVLVGVYGVAVSGLLLSGLLLSQMFETEMASVPAIPWLATTPASTALLNPPYPSDHPVLLEPIPNSISGPVQAALLTESSGWLLPNQNFLAAPVSFQR